MPSDLKFNSTLRIIEIVHTGVVSRDDLRRSTNEVIALQQEHSVDGVLIDATELESISITDLSDLPSQYNEGGASRSCPVALVKPLAPETHRLAQFYDNVCNYRGWSVQQFESRDEAVVWLTSDQSS